MSNMEAIGDLSKSYLGSEMEGGLQGDEELETLLILQISAEMPLPPRLLSNLSQALLLQPLVEFLTFYGNS